MGKGYMTPLSQFLNFIFKKSICHTRFEHHVPHPYISSDTDIAKDFSGNIEP